MGAKWVLNGCKWTPILGTIESALGASARDGVPDIGQ